MKRHNLGVCIESGCGWVAVACERCGKHYRQFRKGRSFLLPRGRKPQFVGVDRHIVKLWRNIRDRCNYPGTHKFEYYGGRGIKNWLTPYDVQFLWERDKASDMQRPSIDRKKSDQDYTLENCQFIELIENIKKSWRNRRKRSLAIAQGKRRARDQIHTGNPTPSEVL